MKNNRIENEAKDWPEYSEYQVKDELRSGSRLPKLPRPKSVLHRTNI
ncbi:MAG: hypothetical protein WAM70_14730 [Pyrinomonadaceae bacterium]